MSQTEPLPSLLEEQRLARVRRRRARSLWLDVRPFALLGAAALTVLLGVWGFQESQATANGGLFDNLYRSVRLFGLAGGDIDPPVSWQLQIARVLAPLLVGYAAVRGLVALFREQALLLRLRLMARGHIVVIGLGGAGFRIASAMSEAGHMVVAIERDKAHHALSGCRDRGIAVVFGDGTDAEAQARARTDRARHVFISTGGDATNLRALAACSELSKDPGWQPATAHVLLETTSLWRALCSAQLTMGGNAALRTEFVSVPDLAGRAIVDSNPTVWDQQDRPAHLVAIARSEIGRSAVVHAVRRLLAAQRPTKVTLTGPSANEDLASLVGDDSWIERATDLAAVPVDPASADPGPIEHVDETTMSLVCDQDAATGLARAQGLVAMTPGSDSPVVVLVDNDDLAGSLGTAGLRLDRVQPVGALQRALGPALLFDTTLETIARAKHQDYVRHEVERGTSVADNRSMVGWDDLPESLKESNRRFADGVAQKILAIGGRVIPEDPSRPAPPELSIPADALDELAEKEHERWVADLISDGWSHTSGAKDPDQKLHPSLIRWEALPEDERDKDREPIRNLPRLLAAAGYSLVRPEG